MSMAGVAIASIPMAGAGRAITGAATPGGAAWAGAAPGAGAAGAVMPTGPATTPRPEPIGADHAAIGAERRIPGLALTRLAR